MSHTLPKQVAFAKSLSGQYLFVCENFAEAAGLDSPAQAVGCRDADFVWKDQAERYREADIRAFKGGVLANHPQLICYAAAPDKIRHTLETKTALRDSQNRIIGVIGSAIDVTDHQIVQCAGRFDQAGKKFMVNSALAHLTFSKKQIAILKYLVQGYSAADIGVLLYRSKRTIEGHIEQLKNKLQCTSKAEIIRFVVMSGLLHSIL